MQDAHSSALAIFWDEDNCSRSPAARLRQYRPACDGSLVSLAQVLEQYDPLGYSLCAQSFQHTINMTFKGRLVAACSARSQPRVRAARGHHPTAHRQGTLPPGTMLPSVEQLMAEFEVSRVTLRGHLAAGGGGRLHSPGDGSQAVRNGSAITTANQLALRL